MRNHHNLFSLVELLVTIAIIAILTSMLLPALKNARGMAKRSACQSNLKQWGVTFSIYTSDYDGWLPDPKATTWSTQGWATQIDKVMDKTLADYGTGVGKNYGIWQCPENTLQERCAGTNCSKGDKNGSYQPNGFDTTELFLGTKVSMHRKPGLLHALYDGCNYKNEPWNNDGGGTDYAIGMRHVRYCHGKGLNMLYADAHVQWLPPVLEYRGTFIGGGGQASAFTNGWAWYCR